MRRCSCRCPRVSLRHASTHLRTSCQTSILRSRRAGLISWPLAAPQAGALRAMRPYKSQPPAKQRAGRHTRDRGSATSAERAVFREWLLIAEAKLDLEVALLRFPGDGSHQADLLAALRRVA